ncbi:MAG: secretion protein HlyD, partial [Acidimicrobiales bacterium]|nr:secretion protein HlyD [Acidimicrobiales bacterium]
QLTSDQASLNAAQAQLASAQTSLAGATLTSPMDGTVAVVNLTVGQQLSGTGTSGTSITGTGTGSGRSSASSGSASSGAGSSATGGSGNGAGASSSSSSSSTTQIQVISTGSYVVNLNVDDTQIGRIAAGQQATITPSSSPAGNGATRRLGGAGGQGATGQGGQGGQAGQSATSGQGTNAQGAAGGLGQTATPTATGTVSSVGAIASSSSGVASFPVVVTVTGTPSGFFAGSTVQVAITYNELPNALEVPTLAVTRTNGQDYVTVSQNGTHSQRAVTTGIVSGGQTQITSGLTRGELVVVTIPTATANGATPNNTATGNRVGGFGGTGGFGGGGGGGGGFVRGGD